MSAVLLAALLGASAPAQPDSVLAACETAREVAARVLGLTMRLEPDVEVADDFTLPGGVVGRGCRVTAHADDDRIAAPVDDLREALEAALALVRPYDAALLAGVEGLAVLLTSPAREWPRRLLPVLALTPALAYDAWLFLAGPGFSVFSSPLYAQAPAAGDLAVALGPAALLALTAVRLRGEAGAGHRLRLAFWAALALLVVLVRPVSFSLQLVVGIGVPLLVLAAVGLARLPRGGLEGAVPSMATTAVVATWLCAAPSPGRHVPAERWQVARALREA